MASRQGMASSTPLCSQPEGTWCSSCISEILPKTETESSQKAPAGQPKTLRSGPPCPLSRPHRRLNRFKSTQNRYQEAVYHLFLKEHIMLFIQNRCEMASRHILIHLSKCSLN